MNKLLIRSTHELCLISIRFVYVQREAFSEFFIRFQCMSVYLIYLSYVGINWLKCYSVTGPLKFYFRNARLR